MTNGYTYNEDVPRPSVFTDTVAKALHQSIVTAQLAPYGSASVRGIIAASWSIADAILNDDIGFDVEAFMKIVKGDYQ